MAILTQRIEKHNDSPSFNKTDKRARDCPAQKLVMMHRIMIG
jgi:hypothetical protein